jgi:ABC-type multidrug transport system fused ATPase/permease subunit
MGGIEMKKIKTSLRIFFKSFIYCLVAPVVVLAEDGTCPPLSEYISEGTGNNFLLNSAFESVIKACNTVAELSWNSFAEPLQLVVALGAAIYIAGGISVGNISSFVLYSRKFSGPIHEIAEIWGDLQSAIAAAERVFRILDEEPESADAPDAGVLENTRGAVELRDITFGYDADKPVLQNFSLQ